MVKNFKKNHLLQNQKADDLETWYVASGVGELPNLFKWWHILQQGQIWSLMLLYGEKGKTMDFSETIVVYDLKLATGDQSDKKSLLTSKLFHLGCIKWKKNV